MKDLLFWKENATNKDTDLINIDHLLQLGTLIDGTIKFKSSDYDIQEVKEVSKFIYKLPFKSEEEIEEILKNRS